MKPFPEPSFPLAPASPQVKCLACGHSNSWADSSCQACGSSLDLKLCSSCEAINAKSAERCHACGAEFNPPIPGKALPALTTYTIDGPRSTGRRALAILALAVVLTAALALAYRYQGDFFYSVRQAAVAAPLADKQEPPASVPVRTEPDSPPPAAVQPAVKQVPKLAAVKEAPKASVPQRPADLRPAPRANRAVAAVHAPSDSSAALLHADESAEGSAAVAGVSASLPQVPMGRPRVTHTKAVPSDAPLPAAGVVARPSIGSKGCSDAVAALGLCGRNEKGEGE